MFMIPGATWSPCVCYKHSFLRSTGRPLLLSHFDSLTPRPLPGPMWSRRPTLVVTAFFFRRWRHRASSSTFIVFVLPALPFPYKINSVGMLCSILSWCLHSRTKSFRSSIRTYHVISVRPFIVSSHLFVYFPHNTLLSLGRASTTSVLCF